jgi:hypothetical protein
MTGSNTITVRPAHVQTERVHDYLYDKDYHVSGPRDHNRATYRSKTNDANVKQLYRYDTMFSELRHHPRYQTVLQQTDPVPEFIGRNWTDRAAHDRITSVRYDNRDCGGEDRYKYFRRPVVPYAQAPADVILEPPKPTNVARYDEPTDAHRTIGTQTDYRDQETQTEPYSPEYKVVPGEAPEILTLAALKHGRGLPAGVAEVEMIERARDKRAWEASLPPLTDPEQFQKRRIMMEAREKHEWQLREKQIQEIQNARLEVLQSMLADRERKQQEIIEERLDRTLTKDANQTEEKINKIRKEHILKTRALRCTRSSLPFEINFSGRDIIYDYTNYDSEVYAPIARHGVFPDRGSEQYNVKSKYLDTYQGLCEMETSLGSALTETKIRPPAAKRGPDKDGYVRRKERLEWDLKETYDDIKASLKEKEQSVHKRVPRLLKEVPKPVPRPETPTQQGPGADFEERQIAATLLQKLIRGGASRKKTLSELSRRIDLVEEVRSTHILLESERTEKEAEKLRVMDQRHGEKLERIDNAQVAENVHSVAGGKVQRLLDFLHKELIRLQDERRCHAFTLLAERKRRLREAKEAGQRQEEERRRREEDEIWREVFRTRQASVDKYLLAIATQASHNAAAELAEKQIEELAQTIDESGMSERDQSAELVYNFLIPEVLRREHRSKFHQNRDARLEAARSLLHETGESSNEADSS